MLRSVMKQAVFHTSGYVNRHSVRIWGTENPQATVEHSRDCPKVTVFCALSNNKIYGSFFFAEETVTGIVYLDMPENWLLLQLNEYLGENLILEQDGALADYYNAVTGFLNENLPGRWIVRGSWPPRSPDLTPMDYLYEVSGTQDRICQYLESTNTDTLRKAWAEFAYRLDVVRVTRGAHIGHVQVEKKTSFSYYFQRIYFFCKFLVFTSFVITLYIFYKN
jgi:hypothetical protein